MKVTLNWLKQYVEFDWSATELAERLTMLGLEVEGVQKLGGEFEGIVVAQVISRDKHPNADKLSLVLHLAHKPGSLCSALNAFARRNLNLLKIESRPIPGMPWSYCFYLDLQASLKNADTRAALEELEEFADSVKILGCYPQAKV